MRILIVPDIHLGVKSFGKDYVDKINSRIQDQLDLMEFVYQQAMDNDIERMILQGDIFDEEHPEPILISLFFKWLSKCTDSFDVDIVMGNHDYKRNGNNIISILDCIPAARIKKCKVYKNIETVNYDDLAITYIPFTDRDEMGYEKNIDAVGGLIEKINNSLHDSGGILKNKRITIGHIAIEKSIYVGDEICNEYKELFLPTHAFDLYNYTWMGHIHNPQVLSKKPFVAHLGSLDKKTFSEGDKFICLYDSDKNDFVDIKLPCRELIDLVIDVPEDIQDTTDYIKTNLENNKMNYKDSIVRVQINIKSGNSQSLDKKEISQLFADSNVQNIAAIIEKKQTNAIVNDKDSTSSIDESLNATRAITIFIPKLNLESNIANDVESFCQNIVEEINKELAN